ncbi:hypothetical protein ACLOJK_027117, partial [Asimina triloba]
MAGFSPNRDQQQLAKSSSLSSFVRQPLSDPKRTQNRLDDQRASIVVQRLILQLGSRPPKSSRSASPNQHPRCRTWTQSVASPITSSAAGGKQSPHRSKQKFDRC